MDIDRVRYFQVFSELGSLVRASEVLRISQPALSKALRLLETEVGSKLLEPDGRGLRLTREGEIFRQETKPLLDSWLSVPGRIRGIQPVIPTRIGSFEVFTTYFLGHLLKFENVENLEIHEYVPGQLENAVSDGRVDIGITYVPIPRAGVAFTEVTRIRMGVFGTANLKSELSDKTFEQLPFAIPVEPLQGTPTKVIGLDGWPDHKFSRNVRFRVTLMESALELCRKGRAVAYLPEFVVRLHNENVRPEFQLKEIKSPIPAKDRLQSVFLISRATDAESPLARNIARSLRKLEG